MGTGNGGRPRLTERHRAERTELIRQEILDAALTEFAERGYQETTIAHIGQRLGLAPSMIYNYFTNKRDILEQAVVPPLRFLARNTTPDGHRRFSPPMPAITSAGEWRANAEMLERSLVKAREQASA